MVLSSYNKTAKYTTSTDSKGIKSFHKLEHELVRLGSLPADTEFKHNNQVYKVLQESPYHRVSATNGNVQVVNLTTRKSGTLARRFWVEVIQKGKA